MYNVLNVEFYKTSRRKSVLICIVVAIVISCIITVVSSNTYSKDWFYLMADDISNIMFVFAMIIPVMIITSEFNDNTMKNMLFSGICRTYLYISKILVIGVVITLINFIIGSGGIIILTMKNGWGGNFDITHIINLLSSMGKMSLVMFAYCCIFSLIGLVTRNIISSIALSYGTRIIEVLLLIISNNFKWLSWLKNIILINNLDPYFIQGTSDNKALINVTFLCLAIIVSTTIIAIIAFNQQDIKS